MKSLMALRRFSVRSGKTAASKQMPIIKNRLGTTTPLLNVVLIFRNFHISTLFNSENMHNFHTPQSIPSNFSQYRSIITGHHTHGYALKSGNQGRCPGSSRGTIGGMLLIHRPRFEQFQDTLVLVGPAAGLHEAEMHVPHLPKRGVTFEIRSAYQNML